jgi:prepilin-type N-terminal cleavage/methylation domain-containing protein
MKKGFTIIEVLAVVVIITLITLLVVPNLLNNVNNKKKDISDSAKQMIYEAADMYIKENSSSYPVEDNATYCIKLETLVNSGKLSNPIKDLKTNKEIPLNFYVKTTINEFNQYDYILVDNKSCVPAIAYYITDNGKYTKEKTVTIKYPQSNYVKKYKVTSGTTKENITLNEEQTTSEDVTLTFTTNGVVKFWIEDNGEKSPETEARITKIDTTAPTLALSKKTYKETDFSDWELTTNSSVTEENGHKVLVLGANGSDSSAKSPYYETNGGGWIPSYEAWTNTVISNEKGGIYNGLSYFDSEKSSTSGTTGSSSNGVAFNALPSTWTPSTTDSRYQLSGWFNDGRGNSVKYVRITFANGVTSPYSRPTVKVRNFKFYAENMPNSFYLINVTATDADSKIKDIKYAKGDKDARYFENAGEVVENNQIRVTSNGVYSVCATDKAGNMKIEKITIDKIN